MQQQNPQKVEAGKVPEYIKKAAKKAAEFNSNFNRERMEERRAYFDLQTHVCSWMTIPFKTFNFSKMFSFITDYTSPAGQIQSLGSRADQNWALSCGPHPGTVPRVL